MSTPPTSPRKSRRTGWLVGIGCLVAGLLASVGVATVVLDVDIFSEGDCGDPSIFTLGCIEPSDSPNTSPAESASPSEPDDADLDFKVGGCARRDGAVSTAIDCAVATPDDYLITDEVSHPSGCADKQQPVIEAADGASIYCLVPYQS